MSHVGGVPRVFPSVFATVAGLFFVSKIAQHSPPVSEFVDLERPLIFACISKQSDLSGFVSFLWKIFDCLLYDG